MTMKKIDEILDASGYTVSRDTVQNGYYTLRSDTGDCWLFEGKMTRKELVEFINNL